ncbi:MAG TPA: serine/threonine-protein kinase [Verrucomicrobiae bacterium]|jgi:serine/threonine protein kinase|nr:serine/threonine-protein kinase [Verrucomicrobiae bacterium]
MPSDQQSVQDRPAPKPGPFGRFYLQELINSGGMADIWLATDQEQKSCAIRKLHDDLRFNFLARRRFVRGCEILAHIHNHEHVIGYLEHGRTNGTLYCAMEYVESSNLKQVLVRNDPILVENVGNILIDMAVALEHVHDSGFMHLDFKPENVLITRNAAVRLVDFDLAQPRPDKPRKVSKNPGTPAYMPPEQLLREPFDHRADIFAYGVTAYEVLTGRKPFAGDTPEEILRNELDRTGFATPREINPDIPIAVEKSILKSLERDPDKRHPIISVLVVELKAALYV